MPIYLGSWLTGAVLTGLASVVLMFAVAIPVFGVDIYPRMLPAAIVTLVLGAATLAALGLAVASLVQHRRPGDAGRAAHVPAAVVHLGHLVPARRRARLGRRRSRTSSRSTTWSTRSTRASCRRPPAAAGRWNDLGGDRAVGASAATWVAVRRFRAEPAGGEPSRLRAPLQCVTRRRPGLTGSGTDLRSRRGRRSRRRSWPRSRYARLARRRAAGSRRTATSWARRRDGRCRRLRLRPPRAGGGRSRDSERRNMTKSTTPRTSATRCSAPKMTISSSSGVTPVRVPSEGRRQTPVSLPSPAALWLPPTPARSR